MARFTRLSKGCTEGLRFRWVVVGDGRYHPAEGLLQCAMHTRDAFIDLFGHQSLGAKVGQDCGAAGAKLSRCTRADWTRRKKQVSFLALVPSP